MKKIIICICSLFIFSISHADSLENNTKQSWLYVLAADSASVTPDEGRAILTLDNIKSKTFSFTDKPAKFYKLSKTVELMTQWGAMFPDEAKPNASLVFDSTLSSIENNDPIMITILSAPIFNSSPKQMTLSVSIDNIELDKTIQLKDVYLLIDNGSFPPEVTEAIAIGNLK